MKSSVVVSGLRVLMAGSLLTILFLQLVGLPWLSGEMAKELPAEAYMRWPILVLSIVGLGCVQVGLFSTFHLLGLTNAGDVFSGRALHWVDAIIGASLAGSLVCLTTLIYQSFTVGGPPIWMLLLVGGIFVGVGIALLLTVMRTLLVQATDLRRDMEAVI